jgi:hypothetical protein
MTDEQYRQLMAALLHIEYQNRLILWTLAKTSRGRGPRPMPPAGVIVTDHPDGTSETRPDPDGL